MDEHSETAKKIVAQAMETWIDAQRRASELLLGAQQPGHPVDWGEGARWVTRIASLAQEWAIEYADPLRPTIYSIERVGAPLPPDDWTPEVAAERIALAARWMLFIAHSCVAMWKGFSASVNRITGGAGKDHTDAQEDEVRTHSASDMAYMGGNWRIAPNQALKITIHPARGGARYWGIVLVNPWMESYEYRQRHVCTNDQLAARNPDGSWPVATAHR